MCHTMIDLDFSDIQLLLLAVAEALEIIQVFCADCAREKSGTRLG